MILLVVAFVLNGSLTLLDPEYGVWTDAVYSSWGNQTFVTPGLSGPAWIVRDGAGTVHIYASNDASQSWEKTSCGVTPCSVVRETPLMLPFPGTRICESNTSRELVCRAAGGVSWGPGGIRSPSGAPPQP